MDARFNMFALFVCYDRFSLVFFLRHRTFAIRMTMTIDSDLNRNTASTRGLACKNHNLHWSSCPAATNNSFTQISKI
jgi:hypothetical protein